MINGRGLICPALFQIVSLSLLIGVINTKINLFFSKKFFILHILVNPVHVAMVTAEQIRIYGFRRTK